METLKVKYSLWHESNYHPNHGQVYINDESKQRVDLKFTGLVIGPGYAGGNDLYFVSNGILHNPDGPAIIQSNTEYWLNGFLHREDGPARNRLKKFAKPGEIQEYEYDYFINGVLYDHVGWLKKQKKTKHWTTIMGMALGEGRQWKP